MSRPFYLHWRTLIYTSLLGAALAFAVSFITPIQYSSSVRLLITQVNATGLDPYTAVKSTERIAQNLTELIYTTTFFDNMLVEAKDFDPSYFPSDEYDKRKLWRKTIDTSVVANTGILTVTAYHPTRAGARALVEATSKELSVQAPNYFGYSVRAQIIDTPLDSRWIARPDFLQNSATGLLFGFIVGIAWILWKQYRRE